MHMREAVLNQPRDAGADREARNRIHEDQYRESHQLPARRPPVVLEIRNMQRDLDPIDPVPRLRLVLEVIPDDRLAQHPAEQPFAHVPNQVTPLGPMSPRKHREMNMYTPEVQTTRQEVIPVVLHAGDRLESEVIQSHDDQGPDVNEYEAVHQHEGLVPE